MAVHTQSWGMKTRYFSVLQVHTDTAVISRKQNHLTRLYKQSEGCFTSDLPGTCGNICYGCLHFLARPYREGQMPVLDGTWNPSANRDFSTQHCQRCCHKVLIPFSLAVRERLLKYCFFLLISTPFNFLFVTEYNSV